MQSPFRPNDSYDRNDALRVVIDNNGWHDMYPVRGFHKKGVVVRMERKRHHEGIIKTIPYKKVIRYALPWA